jgi:hypothetical protein
MKPGLRPSTGPGARCSSCGRPIVWALTDTGRRMPVDTIPVPPVLIPEARDGNVVLWFEVDAKDRPTGGQRVSFATEEQRKDPKVPLWRSHFATCPHASKHRRAS